jgi:peptidoglycan/LPS O-acetylase OafA/YrhL
MPSFKFLSPQNRSHIPSLDGLRATAIMLVFFAHVGYMYNVSWMGNFPGGFGVTVFFFLSGYLITTLLRREFEHTGSISFRKFYLRRAYRIFPPLYIVLFLIFLLAIFGVVQHQMRWGAVLSEVFFWSNYYNLVHDMKGTFFVPTTGVTWSLAIEEQFYILFPIGLLALLRRMNYERIARILFTLCVIALLWRCLLVYGMNVSGGYTYGGTDTRYDSLLYGCILGLWRNPVYEPEWKFSIGPRTMFVIAILLLLSTFIYRDEAFRATFRYTVQGIALFPIFWLAIRYPEWPIFSWFNWPFVRFVGAISFTVYLSHVMALEFADRLLEDKLPRAILGTAFTLSFSTLMYVLVEGPLAKLRQQLHRD